MARGGIIEEDTHYDAASRPRAKETATLRLDLTTSREVATGKCVVERLRARTWVMRRVGWVSEPRAPRSQRVRTTLMESLELRGRSSVATVPLGSAPLGYVTLTVFM